MYTAAINLSIIDIVGLNVMAIVLGVVVHMVITTRRKLKKMMQESESQLSLSGNSYPSLDDELELRRPAAPGRKPAPQHEADDMEADWLSALPFIKKITKPARQRHTPHANSEIATLKNNIEQQQRSLNQLLQQVGQWRGDDVHSRRAAGEVATLQALLDDKEAELQKVKQQLGASQKITARMEDVYREFEELQQKIERLEKQAKGAGELAIELEEMQEAHKQVKRELMRKQEKLQEAVEENQRLYRQLGETEDKLSEANLQRQQLLKKVQYLENMHNELQQVADANKKLQNELRRIGELESMLSMVSDERDILLKRRLS